VRFDGEQWRHFTTADGLLSNNIKALLHDSQNRLWMGGWGSGVALFDGLVFQHILRLYGLVSDMVQQILERQSGEFSIATEAGLTLYRPSTTPPSIRLSDVKADRDYGAIESLEIPSSQNYLRFEFQGTSLFTPPERMAYVYRLRGFDDEWQVIREEFVEYGELPRGDYTFEVKAVDRDLNYSKPVAVEVQIHLPYERVAWIGSLSIALLLVAWQGGRLVQRNRQLRHNNLRLSIERSVERVRAEALSMQRTDDLLKVVAVLYSGMNRLGIDTPTTDIALIDEDDDEHIHYRARINPKKFDLSWSSTSYVEYDENTIVTIAERSPLRENDYSRAMYDYWKRGEVQTQEWTLDEHNKQGFAEHFRKDLGLVDDAPYTDSFWARIEGKSIVNIPFEHGMIGFMHKDLNEEQQTMVQDLGRALSIGYLRFLDFQQLEAQNLALAEARDRAEAANRAKSGFLANISHEIRTPMNAILGYAQLLRHEDLSASQRTDIERIQASGHHLLGLINEVLDLSKIEAGQLQLNEQNFDLNELANSLDSMFAWRCKEKGLGWELSWDGDSVVAVSGDASKLTQVLINLLGNAVKFSDAGMVSLRIAKEHEQHYRFEVRDTGVGIPAAEQEQLFQAFQQGEAGAQRGGTGLGLAIARQLVEFMGGELHLDSQSGQGSTFAFAIALAKGSPDALRENERSSTKLKLKSDVHVRALVADDVEDNRTILRRVLEQVGLEVELAKNGREALEKIENGSFEIIFLDIRMPVMDGREVVRAVRKRPEWHALRVVAVSASVLDHERNDFLAAGFDDFVGKPFEEAQIVECLRSQLQVELVAVASESAEPAHTPEQVPDLSTLVLPATLHAQLLQSAKLSRVTEIDEGLRKLDRLGTQERQLAEYLRVVLRRYDIDGIVQILEGVTHE
jgi:signal transduction histidine kinase/DNA-binding NarL/FixJ family response regulator